MAKMVKILQDEVFAAAQAVAQKQDFDYRGAYASYIGELEAILLRLAMRDRVAEGEIEHMLRDTLERFKGMIGQGRG